MFSILVRRRPIHLDCFTSTHAYDNAPIETAHRFIPEWWKNLPNSYIPDPNALYVNPTMKSCAGFVDLFTKGVMLPMWSDLTIEVRGEQLKWQYADGYSKAGTHSNKQMAGFIDSIEAAHIKLHSPWYFKCNEDIYWHCSDPVWNTNAGRDFTVATGVISLKYQFATNINMFVRHGDKTITIPYMQPMLHVVPLSERPVKVHNHLISDEEYTQMGTPRTTMLRSYYKRKKAMQERESKCPFGFGK